MQSIKYSMDAKLAVVRQADVVVVGAGPGGIGAAVMAARGGARTLLVERYGLPGGMASFGEVHPFMANHLDGQPLDKPVYTDWVAAMERLCPGQAEKRGIHKDVAALAAEDICVAAGVELLYHHQLFDVVKAGRDITALVLFSKSGLTAVQGKIYIDCTGDADLAARAGCAFEQGDGQGLCQPMTLCFKLGGIDRERSPKMDEINCRFTAAKARGEIECPRENVLIFSWRAPDVIHFNTTRVVRRSGTSGEDLSAAEVEGRRQLRQILEFLRREIPGYEKAEIYSVAHHIGVRETRRVLGRQYLTRAAFEEHRKFPDGIARVRYPIDIHNPAGSGTEIVHMPPGEWYEIPYGCLVPKDADNLLVGGRPISVDHALHSSMRVMPPACTIGQAAGLAAALCVRRGGAPASLDGAELRRELKARGASL